MRHERDPRAVTPKGGDAHRATIERLRAAVRRGATLRQAASQLGVAKSTLYDRARKARLPLRRRGLSPDKERRLLEAFRHGAGVRAAARAAQVSTETAWRRYHARLRQVLGALAEGAPRSCTPWRCPTGGELLAVDRCILHGTVKPRRTAKRPRAAAHD